MGDVVDEEFERVLRPFLPSLAAGAPLPADADLAALGLDSLRCIQLMFAVEDAFGVSFPDEMLGPALFATPAALSTGVRELIGGGRG